MNKNVECRGFTLLEILMVITIMGILITIILGVFSGLNKTESLGTSVKQVASIVEQARSLTLSSKNDTKYGVHFESDKVVLFSGPTYSLGDPGNITSNLNPLVSISTIALTGGGSEISFNRLIGSTPNAGNIVIQLKSDVSKTKTLTVSGTGVIEISN